MNQQVKNNEQIETISSYQSKEHEQVSRLN